MNDKWKWNRVLIKHVVWRFTEDMLKDMMEDPSIMDTRVLNEYVTDLNVKIHRAFRGYPVHLEIPQTMCYVSAAWRGDYSDSEDWFSFVLENYPTLQMSEEWKNFFQKGAVYDDSNNLPKSKTLTPQENPKTTGLGDENA